MSDDIGSDSACFCFSPNLRSAAQFAFYGRLMTLDNSLLLNPNWCHHPLITQLRQKDSLLQYTMTLLQGPKDPVLPTLAKIGTY